MLKRLLTLVVLFGCAAQLWAAPAAKPRRTKAAPVKVTDTTKPGFLYQPVVYASYVMSTGQHPVMTFSADEDVRVVIWETDARGENRVNSEPIFTGRLKKGVKQDVEWLSLALPNGRYNYHVVMTDKAGNGADYDVPITVDIVNNPNGDLILY